MHLQIPAGKGDQEIELSALSEKFVNNVTRLPIVDADKKPKYMIHDSSISKYLTGEGGRDDTLAQFITAQKNEDFEYGVGKGFVLVPLQSTLAEAKRKMEEKRPCQDIFITKNGSVDEPLLGWISNVRLFKYIKA